MYEIHRGVHVPRGAFPPSPFNILCRSLCSPITRLSAQVLPLYGNTHTTTSVTGSQSTAFRCVIHLFRVSIPRCRISAPLPQGRGALHHPPRGQRYRRPRRAVHRQRRYGRQLQAVRAHAVAAAMGTITCCHRVFPRAPLEHTAMA
jgi:hypothetical protein